VAVAAAVVTGGVLGAAPAFADSWKYPGGVTCNSSAKGITYSKTYDGTKVQHRA